MSTHKGFIWSDAIYSPESMLTGLEISYDKFVTHPKDRYDHGWGEPFYDNNGTKIPMGTFDGPNQIKSLMIRDNEWVKNDEPGTQLYGNIDWIGPIFDETELTDSRVILTWHGPRMRYFADPDFDYDAETSKNIYFGGKYALIAPLPVLGAGAKRVDGEWLLFVICKDGEDDIVYMYRMNMNGWGAGDITQELKDNFASEYDQATNPYGYVEVYTLSSTTKSTVKVSDSPNDADTPWFFNESCTMAICLRAVDSTYVDSTDTEYTETNTIKYMLDIGVASGYDFVYSHNMARNNYIEQHKYIRYLNTEDSQDPNDYMWLADTLKYEYGHSENDGGCLDPATNNHYYVRFALEQSISDSGKQIIAVDYDGDIEVEAVVTMDSSRSHKQEMNWGVDEAPEYGSPYSNACDNTGMPRKLFKDERYFLDFSSDPFFGGKSFYTVSFTNSDGDHEFSLYKSIYGTQYMRDHNGDPDPASEGYGGFEYHGYTKRFIHFMDLRSPALAFFTELVVDEFTKHGSYSVPDPYRMVKPYWPLSTKVDQNEGYYEGKMVTEDEPTYLERRTISSVTRPYETFICGFDYSGNADVPPDPHPTHLGPNWELTPDVSFENEDEYDPDAYYFWTEHYNSSWYNGLNLRSADVDLIVPYFDEYWAGVLKINKWQSWQSFFNNTHHDDVLDKDLHLSYVNGNLARNGSDWLVSYEQPSYAEEGQDPLVGSGTIYNLLNNNDIIGLFKNTYTLYPVGAI